MRLEKLVYMANQIGDFFKHQKEDEAVEEIAGHLKSFWEKRMLTQIFEHLEAGGQGLHERVKKALAALHHANP
jgi:formate dehydrogenase subunit delta